jgi:two-component system, NarL family, sensor histidine kinase UhpB
MMAGVALSFHNARMNALAEIASAEKSTLYLFDNAIVGAAPTSKLDLSPDKLQQLFKLQQLSHMRHLKIELVDSKGKLLDSNQAANNEQFNNEAPAWFVQLLNKTMPQWQPKVRSLVINNQLLAKLVITPDPSFEYAEIWKQITDLIVLLALFFISVNLMIAWAIAQALKPTETILGALDEIESGRLSTRLPSFKLPEMARIGQKFNHMIESLQQSHLQNHKLTQQLMTLQEAERKSLARDLHDEFGQCLTAINTDANVILKQAKTKYPELQASAEAISELSRHLMDIVSGLLQRLRPGVLDELGLQVALQDLVGNWRNRNPNISCEININNADDFASLNETQNLVIYRLVQESLTNIARHANATSAKINVFSELKNMQYGIGIKVQDNGVGFKQNNADGLGLAGMRERVESLNGDFYLLPEANIGSTIAAWLPLRSNS